MGQIEASNLGANLSAFFEQAARSGEMIKQLEQKVLNLEGEVKELKQSKTEDGWMKLRAAAEAVGMTACALRQRRSLYAEGTVWKKEEGGKNASIWFNLKTLREQIALNR